MANILNVRVKAAGHVPQLEPFVGCIGVLTYSNSD